MSVTAAGNPVRRRGRRRRIERPPADGGGGRPHQATQADRPRCRRASSRSAALRSSSASSASWSSSPPKRCRCFAQRRRRSTRRVTLTGRRRRRRQRSRRSASTNSAGTSTASPPTARSRSSIARPGTPLERHAGVDCAARRSRLVAVAARRFRRARDKRRPRGARCRCGSRRCTGQPASRTSRSTSLERGLVPLDRRSERPCARVAYLEEGDRKFVAGQVSDREIALWWTDRRKRRSDRSCPRTADGHRNRGRPHRHGHRRQRARRGLSLGARRGDG